MYIYVCIYYVIWYSSHSLYTIYHSPNISKEFCSKHGSIMRCKSFQFSQHPQIVRRQNVQTCGGGFGCCSLARYYILFSVISFLWLHYTPAHFFFFFSHFTDFFLCVPFSSICTIISVYGVCITSISSHPIRQFGFGLHHYLCPYAHSLGTSLWTCTHTYRTYTHVLLVYGLWG